MSLKAKIEAVIYASEEPVTLAQLVGLLGHEAQAELDQLASAQHTLSLNETEVDLEEAAESDPTLNPEAPAEASAPATETSETEAGEGTEVPAEAASETPAAPSADEAAARAAKAEKEKARELRDYFRTLLEVLIADYASADRGIEIREVAGGYRLATKPEYHDAVRGFVKSLKPPLKLSLQALETLAVVAYKQPVTAPEISEIRGVDTGGVLGSLMTRKLVTTAGRKQVIGRPILYKTTKDFLLRFGLKDISELPSIEEFEKMAGELADNEPLQEEMEMSHAPQADGSPDTADNPLDITVEDALEDNPFKDNVSDLHAIPEGQDAGQEAEQGTQQITHHAEEGVTMSIPDANLPDTISTPEGDAEDATGIPLTSEAEDLFVPPGSAPNPYDSDKTEPTGVEKFIDEIVRGEYM